jgi:hypothetical protein
VLPSPEQAQLLKYYEAEMRKYGRQKPEKGFSGMGYWFPSYPVYIGALSEFGSMASALPPTPEQAQPDADSKIASVSLEAGATSDGQSMGASGVSPA